MTLKKMTRKKVVENYNCRVNSFDISSGNEDLASISKDRGHRKDDRTINRMLTPITLRKSPILNLIPINQKECLRKQVQVNK